MSAEYESVIKSVGDSLDVVLIFDYPWGFRPYLQVKFREGSGETIGIPRHVLAKPWGD